MIPVAAALAKAVAAARLYPADNPTYLNAKKYLDDAMAGLLQLKRTVRFVIGRHTLFFAGEPVLSEELGVTIAAGLHKDGIRELAFHRGLSPTETTDLLHLFTRSPAEAERSNDDLRTLFWDRRFEHVTCVVIDDLLEGAGGDDPIPDEFGRDFTHQVDLRVYDLEDEAAVERAAREMSEKVATRIAADDFDLLRVGNDELEGLRAEMAAENDPRRMRQDFARILVEVLHSETVESSFLELVTTLRNHLAALLDEGNLEDLAWLISVLSKFRAEHPDPPGWMTTAIDGALGWVWQDEPREKLRAKLDRGELEPLQGLSAFVHAVPDEAVRHLCLLLGDLGTGRVRRRLIDLLVERCGASWTALLPFLNDPRWYLVRNVVLILGQVGNRLIAPSLHRVRKHPDYRVRKEALVALDRLDPARAFSELRDALTDEEHRIRIYAAQTLARRGPEAAPALLAVIDDPSFAGRGEDEILAFYLALAHAGGSAVMTHLESAVKPRGLFRKGPSDTIRAAACRALGRIEGARAEGLLQTLQADKTTPVRDAARLALEEARGRKTEASRSGRSHASTDARPHGEAA